jgi:hypothetical protein
MDWNDFEIDRIVVQFHDVHIFLYASLTISAGLRRILVRTWCLRCFHGWKSLLGLKSFLVTDIS